MGSRSKRWTRSEEGQGLVLSLLVLSALLGFAGLAVNIGGAYLADSRLQSSLDAGALGGAIASTQSHGCDSGAIAPTVARLVAENDPAAAAVTVVCQRPSLATPAGSVQVTATAPSAGGFARLFGVASFTVARSARAAAIAGQPFDYAIFQGATGPPALGLNGNVTACQVSDTGDGCSESGSTANVHSNGDAVINGNVTVTGVASASGTVTENGNPSVGGIENGAQVITMPLWNPQELESLPGTTVEGSPANPTTCTVGGNQVITGNLVCFGSIMVAGNVSGSGSLVAFGGNVTLDGNVTTGSGSSGVSIAAFAQGGQGGNITLNGNVTSMDGILYAPQGTVVLNGNTTVVGAVVGEWDQLNGNDTVEYNLAAAAGVPVQKVELIP